MEEFKQPHIIPITDKMYRLEEDYVYHWEDGKVPHRITIKKGFEYDGASVPRFAWSLVGIRPDGLIRAAALVHDFIYRHVGEMPPKTCEYLGQKSEEWEDDGCVWSRKRADRLLEIMMKQASSSKIKRWLVYKFVRRFGWVAWNGHKKRHKDCPDH
jgi:hypothetical protein